MGSLKSLKIRALTRRKENSPDVEEDKAGFSALSGCSDLVVSGKGRAPIGLVVEEKGSLGTCVVEFFLRLRIPNSTGSFKLDRQETGATKVQVSSLDLG